MFELWNLRAIILNNFHRDCAFKFKSQVKLLQRERDKLPHIKVCAFNRKNGEGRKTGVQYVSESHDNQAFFKAEKSCFPP